MSDARSDGDPFAEMYGRLPDPRSGRASAPGTGGTPLSRREAREAAAREAAAREAAAREATARQDAPAADEGRENPDVAPGPVRRGNPDPGVQTSGTTADRPELADLFAGSASTEALGTVPKKKSKRQKRRGRWIGFAVVLVVLVGIGGAGWYVWDTYQDNIRSIMGWEEPKDYEAGQADGEALVTIVSGDNGSSISRTLASAGVTKTPEAFYSMLISTGQSPTFYPGVYKLQKKMTSAAALKTLEDPASKLENSALIREGVTEETILKNLSETLKIPLEDFRAATKDPSKYGVKADSLEGWLFPAMYTFDPGATATDVIKTMVARTVRSLDDAGVPESDRQRILTIASIIQREARSSDDFYKVSRVIENRLKPNNQETFGKLQMDSTAQYGYGEMHDGTASSSQAALDDDNPWNTYVHTGLPVGPISSPGDTAIDAAMHPADGPWMYFVTVNLDTGETVFSATYAEQQKAIGQMQTWCRAHPDSGC